MGVARQRKAIIDGLKENIHEFTAGDGGMKTKDVLELMLATQRKCLQAGKFLGNRPRKGLLSCGRSRMCFTRD